MITNVRSEILRRVCTEGFICNGGKFETYAAVNMQVANEVAVEEVRSGLDCRTREQVWRESFERVGVCV